MKNLDPKVLAITALVVMLCLACFVLGGMVGYRAALKTQIASFYLLTPRDLLDEKPSPIHKSVHDFPVVKEQLENNRIVLMLLHEDHTWTIGAARDIEDCN